MWTSIAVIKHPGGAVTRHAFVYRNIEAAQDAAVAWLERTLSDGDNLEIVNEARRIVRSLCPAPRVLSAEDREFLALCGVSSKGL